MSLRCFQNSIYAKNVCYVCYSSCGSVIKSRVDLKSSSIFAAISMLFYPSVLIDRKKQWFVINRVREESNMFWCHSFPSDYSLMHSVVNRISWKQFAWTETELRPVITDRSLLSFRDHLTSAPNRRPLLGSRFSVQSCERIQSVTTMP